MKPSALRHCRLLLAGLALLGGCHKARDTGTPKAVPVRTDGAIALRLMTFNVRYENPGDGGDHAWRQRISFAVRMIARENPDIIGVQEALHGQAADLWASLPDYEFHGVGREDGAAKGEYSGIFYRRDRFQTDSSDKGTFWLSDTPEKIGSMTWGNEITRVASWIRLLDLATGRSFYVFNTHWDHRNEASREKAALLIAQRIDARKHIDEPVVLLGDFNSNESKAGYRYLTGNSGTVAGVDRSWNHGLLDTYQSLHAAEKNRRTLHFFQGNHDGDVKIDHILASPGATILSAQIVNSDLPLVSDHFPVTAELLFPKN